MRKFDPLRFSDHKALIEAEQLLEWVKENKHPASKLRLHLIAFITECDKVRKPARHEEDLIQENTMQETKHNITGEIRREFFAGETKKTVETLMDERLKQLPQERLVRRVKIGRNSPCPCGSGHKFKKCCIAELRRS